MTTRLPARVGRYEIVDRLGSGGMGVVYLATDPVLRRTVAIKLLTEDNEELRERFAREARSAAALRHHHIVTIYDVGEDEGRPFIAMEFLDGENVAEVIRRRAPLSVGRKLQVLIELCTGLGYAHRSGLVHRDIKPANLVITAEGPLKILDFGIARLTTDATKGLTRAGAIIGTPDYMSPEQAQGRPVDRRSDIFSVGLVMYEFLSYRRAFSGDSALLILSKIVNDEPRPIHEFYPDIDADLERALGRCLAKNPADRYESLGGLAADLERVRARFQVSDTQGATVIVPDLAEARRVEIGRHLDDARAHLSASRFDDAIAASERALALDSEHDDALRLVQAARQALEDRQVRQWLDDAATCVADGALSDAALLIERSLQARPGWVEAQQALEDVRVRRREYERAAERERAVRAAVTKARANMQSGAFDAALRSASEALAFDPACQDAQQIKRDAQAGIAARQEEETRRREEEDRAMEEAARAQREEEARAEREQAARVRREEEARVRREEEARILREAEARRQREEEDRVLREEEARLRREEEDRRWQEAEATRLRLEREEQARREREDLDRRAREVQARREQEERDRRERQQQADRAAATVAETRLQAGTGDFDGALARLRSFAPPHNLVAAAITEIVALQEERLRLQDAKTTTHVLDEPPPVRRLPADGPTPSSSTRTRSLQVSAAVILVAGTAGWFIFGNFRRPPPPPPPPPANYAQVLNDAEARYGVRDVPAALVLLRQIPLGVPEHERAISLVMRMRSDAVTAARVARQKAEAAGSAAEPAFLEGQAKQTEADGLVRPEETERAVALYRDAELAFSRAASAAWTPAQFVAEANRLFTDGQLPRAIDYAVQALARDGRHGPALKFLADRRADAARQAGDARDRARRAGATESSVDFAEGRQHEAAARAITAPADTARAVTTLHTAAGAYGRAYDAAVGAASTAEAAKQKLAGEVQAHLTAADQATTTGDFDAARREIDLARGKDPAHPGLRAAEQRLTDALAERKKKEDADTTARLEERITGGLQQSRGLSDPEAISLLQQLQRDFPNDQRIQQEIARRSRVSPPPPPPPPPPDQVERPAIIKALDKFAAAYAAKSMGAIRTVFPKAPASFQDTFNSFTGPLEWKYEIVSLDVKGVNVASPDGAIDATATLTCSVTITGTKRGASRATPDTRTRRIEMAKFAGEGWKIVSAVDITR